jgi:hypothetical protein
VLCVLCVHCVCTVCVLCAVCTVCTISTMWVLCVLFHTYVGVGRGGRVPLAGDGQQRQVVQEGGKGKKREGENTGVHSVGKTLLFMFFKNEIVPGTCTVHLEVD